MVSPYLVTVPKPILLQIPEPCSEDWNTMAPQATGGRHCTSCAKTVFDFTHLSDDELIKIFNGKQAANLCCQLSETQLHRELIPTPRPPFLKTQWQRAAAIVIAVQAFAMQAAAQQAYRPHTVTAAPTKKAHRQITGQVKTFDGAKLTGPLSFHIRISQSDTIQVITDAAGHFALTLPKHSTNETISWDRQEINKGFIMPDSISLATTKQQGRLYIYWQPIDILPSVEVIEYHRPEIITKEPVSFQVVTGTCPFPPRRSFFQRPFQRHKN